MAVSRFFLSTIAPGEVTLTGDEAAHAAARRLRVGDEAVVFDGQGKEAAARITGTGRGRVTVTIGDVFVRPPDAHVELTLGVCIPKGHRPDTLIEKCAELGVSAIWPMLTEHTAVRPRADRAERWRRIAIEAAKQSRRAWVPDIGASVPFIQVVGRVGEFDAGLVLEPAASRHLLNAIEGLRPAARVLALIGPEGGFTIDERRAAADAGFTSAGLGKTILRVETAAIAVATLVLGWAASRWGGPALGDAGP